MPAIDRTQPALVYALQKANWQVAPKPPNIRVGERDLYPDLLAQREQERILIEVKNFDLAHSLVQ